MRRREFVTLLASTTAATFPFSARAQQSERKRRVGVLMGFPDSDAEAQQRLAAFRTGLKDLGWEEEGNLKLHIRFAGSDTNAIRAAARSLVELEVEAILANPAQAILLFRDLTGGIPIVFANIPDPVGIGLVSSISRPGGNVTGITNFEPALACKWLEMLKEVTPRTIRVGILYDPDSPAQGERLGLIEKIAPSAGVQLIRLAVRDPADLVTQLATLTGEQMSGLIVLPSSFTPVHRKTIATLAIQNRLPAVYPFRFFAIEGGLISYGVDTDHQFRRAGSYISRILKGEKPSHLPVEAPTKFELVINQKTAKELGLTIPPTLLARADEVIE